MFCRNLVVQGVDLGDWMGKRFLLQGVEFEWAQECQPCEWMNRVIAPGGEDFLKGSFTGGLRARIRTSGILKFS
jgi:MOSC domain-containing protein YiiM